MKRIAIVCGLSLFLSLPATVLAQENHSATGLNHGEVEAFADCFRFAPGTSMSAQADACLLISVPTWRSKAK